MNFARENISLILCTNKEEGIDFLCPWRCLKVCQIIKSVFGIIKHLMTCPKGNSEFCFPETFNIEAEGKQNLLFPAGPVIKCFVTPSDSKIEKKLRRNRLLFTSAGSNFPRLHWAWPDHVRIESSCCCFPRELVSFVRPRELVRFDPRHVTRFPPMGKRIWVGRYNKDV